MVWIRIGLQFRNLVQEVILMTISKKTLALAAMAVWLGGTLPAQKPDAAHAAPKAAIDKELIDGDLKRAIALYEQVAATYKADKAVASQALLHVGQCYEKLGQKDAAGAYDRLVKQYGDQKEATAARARLAVLRGPESEGIRIRHFPPAGAGCMPQVLGARLADCHRPEGIFIRDLQTGRERLVVPQSQGRLLPGAISPDEKTLTYFNLSSGLRAVGTDGSGDRLLAKAGFGRTYQNSVPLLYQLWMNDGAHLMMYRSVEEGGKTSFELLSISLADGKTQSLRRIELDVIGGAALSPDDRFVAVKSATQGQDGKILVVPVAGGEAIPLSLTGAVGRIVGWHPSGRILYTTNQTGGSIGIWAIRVEQGKAVGTPELVHAGIHPSTRPWVGRDAAIHFEEWGGPHLVQTSTFDAGAGQLGAPRPATKLFTSGNWGVGYSPDGKSLLYASAYAPATVKIVEQDLASGGETAFSVPYRSVGPVMWDHDGSSFLVGALPAARAEWGVYRFVPATGESKLLAGNVRSFSRTGQTLYFIRLDTTGILRGMDLKTGEAREIMLPGNPEELWGVEVSPDGSQVAFAYNTGGRNGITRLATTRLADGNTRILFEHQTGGLRDPITMGWTADGKGLLYSLPTSVRGSDLWLAQGDGGQPRKLRSIGEAVQRIAVQPNGREVAFATRDHNGGKFWVIENAFTKRGN
ncbi:MAG: hypothetical protein JJE04_22475 [Acidobacteriia bacterium]|nr:hypothetical protein [Terriglobia bacterium]